MLIEQESVFYFHFSFKELKLTLHMYIQNIMWLIGNHVFFILSFIRMDKGCLFWSHAMITEDAEM